MYCTQELHSKDEQEETRHETANDFASSKLSRTMSVLSTKTDISVSDVETNNLDKKPFGLKDLAKLSRPKLRYYVIGIIGACIGGILTPASALLVAEMITSMTGKFGLFEDSGGRKYLSELYDNVKLYGILYLVGAAAIMVFMYMQMYSFKFIGEKVTTRLRNTNFEGLCHQNVVGFFDKKENATGALTADLATNAVKVPCSRVTLKLKCGRQSSLCLLHLLFPLQSEYGQIRGLSSFANEANGFFSVAVRCNATKMALDCKGLHLLKDEVKVPSTRKMQKQAASLGLVLTTPDERKKIIRKLLPLVRSGAAIDFASIGALCRPPRDARTIKKVHDRYIAGEVWERHGPTRNLAYDAVRVNRQLQDLRARKADISDRACADALGIEPRTYAGILKEVELIPYSDIVFSFMNPAFGPRLLKTLSLAKHAIRATVFSLTHLGVAGLLKRKLEQGVNVILLVDKKQAVSPFERPVLDSLLVAGAEIYAQECGQTQHQKNMTVDNICIASGSANPSINGIENSFETLTYHYNAGEVDKTLRQFEREKAVCVRIDSTWLDEQQRASSVRSRAHLALASEGLTAEEQQALPLLLNVPDSGIVPVPESGTCAF